MASKPVVGRHEDGSEYGYATAAKAEKAGAEVVRYQDGTSYEKPAPKKDAKNNG